jgi:hypothetical protein
MRGTDFPSDAASCSGGLTCTRVHWTAGSRARSDRCVLRLRADVAFATSSIDSSDFHPSR